MMAPVGAQRCYLPHAYNCVVGCEGWRAADTLAALFKFFPRCHQGRHGASGTSSHFRM